MATTPTVNGLNGANEKDSRFMQQYSQIANPTAAQQQTWNTLSKQYGVNMQQAQQYSQMKDDRFVSHMNQGLNANPTQATLDHYKNLTGQAYQGQQQQQQPGFDPKQYVNPDSYKTQLMSVEDFSKKYGFDYSREYAEKIAQQKLAEQLASIDIAKREANQDFEKGANALDDDFFQQFQSMQQQQVERGLNAGLKAGQDTQMALGRQQSLGQMYAQLQSANYALNKEEGLARSGAVTEAEKLFQQRLNEAFGNIMRQGEFDQSENKMRLDADMGLAGMMQDQYQFDTQHNFDKDKFNKEHQLAQDKFDFEKEATLFDQNMRTKEFDFMTEKEKTRAKEFMMTYNLSAKELEEKIRSNKEGEKINWAQLSETIRSNKAGESLQAKSIAQSAANAAASRAQAAAAQRAAAAQAAQKASSEKTAFLASVYNSVAGSNGTGENAQKAMIDLMAAAEDKRITPAEYTKAVNQVNQLTWNTRKKELGYK